MNLYVNRGNIWILLYSFHGAHKSFPPTTPWANGMPPACPPMSADCWQRLTLGKYDSIWRNGSKLSSKSKIVTFYLLVCVCMCVWEQRNPSANVPVAVAVTMLCFGSLKRTKTYLTVEFYGIYLVEKVWSNFLFYLVFWLFFFFVMRIFGSLSSRCYTWIYIARWSLQDKADWTQNSSLFNGTAQPEGWETLAQEEKLKFNSTFRWL